MMQSESVRADVRDINDCAALSGGNAQSAEKLTAQPTQRHLINCLNRRQLTGIPIVAANVRNGGAPAKAAKRIVGKVI